jgi:hypothetical protein
MQNKRITLEDNLQLSNLCNQRYIITNKKYFEEKENKNSLNVADKKTSSTLKNFLFGSDKMPYDSSSSNCNFSLKEEKDRFFYFSNSNSNASSLINSNNSNILPNNENNIKYINVESQFKFISSQDNSHNHYHSSSVYSESILSDLESEFNNKTKLKNHNDNNDWDDEEVKEYGLLENTDSEPESPSNLTHKLLPKDFKNEEKYKYKLFKFLRKPQFSHNKTETCKLVQYRKHSQLYGNYLKLFII